MRYFTLCLSLGFFGLGCVPAIYSLHLFDVPLGCWSILAGVATLAQTYVNWEKLPDVAYNIGYGGCGGGGDYSGHSYGGSSSSSSSPSRSSFGTRSSQETLSFGTGNPHGYSKFDSGP